MTEMRIDVSAMPPAWSTPQQSERRGMLHDEAKAAVPLASASDAQAASAASLRSLRQQYPLNMTVDFTKLRANALRRYMAFHRIQEIPGSCREQLAIVVARHFGEQCKAADEATSIASFLSYIKGGRMQQDASDIDSDSQRDSSDGMEDEFDELEHDENEPRRASFPPGAAHDDNAQTDTNSSSSSSEEGNDPMSDAMPVNKIKRSRPLSSSKKNRIKTNASGSSSSPAAASKHNKNKKQRKTRVYCVCKGTSFGNMIACDNKKCSDRSNWYHMACVDLDPSQDPPETWYCPSCQEIESEDVPENQYRKPVASVTYGDMISHALAALPNGKGTFKDICDFVEKEYESQLNWKLESDQRKSPVWKSSVRKILFSNMRFRKHPDDKGLFCLAA